MFLLWLAGMLKNRSDSISMSSAQIGELLGMSQQSAARKLKELEGGGYIRRTKSAGVRFESITLTDKGLDVLKDMYHTLQPLFADGGRASGVVVEGVVCRGLGEGAYYVSEYSAEINRRLGFKPFYGTLNIRPLGDTPDVDSLADSTIKGFRRKGRSFGSIRYAKVSLEGGGSVVDCYLIVPSRTHHRGTLEIISEHNLRSKMGLSDGDRVIVRFIN